MTILLMAIMLMTSIVLMLTFNAPPDVTQRMPLLTAFLRGALLWHVLVMASLIARA